MSLTRNYSSFDNISRIGRIAGFCNYDKFLDATAARQFAIKCVCIYATTGASDAFTGIYFISF